MGPGSLSDPGRRRLRRHHLQGAVANAIAQRSRHVDDFAVECDAKHSTSWRVDFELAGRKCPQRRIAGGTAEERGHGQPRQIFRVLSRRDIPVKAALIQPGAAAKADPLHLVFVVATNRNGVLNVSVASSVLTRTTTPGNRRSTLPVAITNAIHLR